MRSPLVVRILVIVGGLLAAFGLVAGHLNRQLLDGPTFAGNVDEIRRDEAVTAALGEAIASELLLANPDLVALAPLVESVSTRVAGGDLLSGPTRLAARTAYEALVGDADSVVLRIADAAAVVTAVLTAVAPERAPVTGDVSVTLAEIGGQGFSSAAVSVAHTVGVLAWLLPLLALVCFAAAIWLSRSRWHSAGSVGWAVIWAAVAVGVVLVIGGVVVRRFDDDVLGGAVARATWTVVMRPLWWGVVILAIVGAAMVVACGSSAPDAMARQASRARDVVLRPGTSAGVVIRALVAIAIGIAAVVDPIGLIEPLVALGGVGLVLVAIVQIGRVATAARGDELVPAAPAAASTRTGPHPVRLVVAGVAAIVVVAGAVVLARPGRDVESAEAGPGDGTVCNGHAELCGRRFDEVAYAASHNAMSVAGEPGWFLGEQADPIPVQLDQGVRALLVDVWSGIPGTGVVRTAPGSYAEGRAIAEEELGPEIVEAALRIADSIAGEAQGTEARFLCHGLCETGSTPFLDTLSQLRGWMAANPDEIVTLFIEDHVDANMIAADIEAAGLLPLVHQPVVGAPWPTLSEMIRSGRRLVVMVETGSGGAAAPWLVNGFEITQETPYTFSTVDSFNCDPNRGPADAPLFQLNHWLAGFDSLVSDAQLVNQRDVLLPRAEQCAAERQRQPNFVAVNYVALGDLFEVVDELNGLR